MLVCLFVEVFAVLENPGIRQRMSNDCNVNIFRYVSYVCSVYVAVSCSLFGSVCHVSQGLALTQLHELLI